MVRSDFIRVQRPKQYRVVVRTTRFITPSKPTKPPTASFTMVANSAAHLSCGNSICKNKKQEDERGQVCAIEAIPEMQPFLLNGRDMSQAWKKEGIEVLGIFWTRDNAARKDIS